MALKLSLLQMRRPRRIIMQPMIYLPLIKDNFLVEGSAAKTRQALHLQELLEDFDEIPEVESLMLKLRSLEQALEIHTILRSSTDKNAIVDYFLRTCKKQLPP